MVVLVDDNSTDQIQEIAWAAASDAGKGEASHVISGKPLQRGWSGKLWAMHQGIQHGETISTSVRYFLLEDADIEYTQGILRRLVGFGERDGRDLVLLMAMLEDRGAWAVC